MFYHDYDIKYNGRYFYCSKHKINILHDFNKKSFEKNDDRDEDEDDEDDEKEIDHTKELTKEIIYYFHKSTKCKKSDTHFDDYKYACGCTKYELIKHLYVFQCDITNDTNKWLQDYLYCAST